MSDNSLFNGYAFSSSHSCWGNIDPSEFVSGDLFHESEQTLKHIYGLKNFPLPRVIYAGCVEIVVEWARVLLVMREKSAQFIHTHTLSRTARLAE